MNIDPSGDAARSPELCNGSRVKPDSLTEQATAGHQEIDNSAPMHPRRCELIWFTNARADAKLDLKGALDPSW